MGQGKEGKGGGGAGQAKRPPPRCFLHLVVLLLFLYILLAPPALASSPPLINAHLLLAIRVLLPHPQPARMPPPRAPASSITQPLHLSLRLTCNSPSARLTQHRDVVLPLPLPPSSPSPLEAGSSGSGSGSGSGGSAPAEAIFTIERGWTPWQCRVSAFERETDLRVGTKAFTLPGTGEGLIEEERRKQDIKAGRLISPHSTYSFLSHPGSANATAALVCLDIPVRLDRLQRGHHDSRLLRAASSLLHHGLLAAEAAEARACLWAGIARRWALGAVAVIAAEARALASIVASEAAAVLQAAAAQGDDVLLLRALTALGVLVLFAALIPAIRRSLLAASGVEGGKASVPLSALAAGAAAAGSGGVQSGQHEQHEQQQEWAGPRRPFVAADWHCAVHDRAGGVARMDERSLASMAEAGVGAGAGSGAGAAVGDVVGRLLTHRVRGALLSYKGL